MFEDFVECGGFHASCCWLHLVDHGNWPVPLSARCVATERCLCVVSSGSATCKAVLLSEHRPVGALLRGNAPSAMHGRIGDQKFALRVGGGGFEPQDGGGGGSENGLPSPRANFVCFSPMLMGGKKI